MRKILLIVLCIFLVTVCSVQAAGESPLGKKAPEPQPSWGAKLGNVVGDVVDEFEAGGGLNRIVWSAEKKDKYCENLVVAFSGLSQDKRMAYAGNVLKNCELAIEAYKAENKDGKNDRDVAAGYVRLALLYEYLGPEYAANRLDAYDDAIRADPYWGMGWDCKAQMLDQYGFHADAQAVRDEKDRVWGEHTRTGGGLLEIFGYTGEPLSDIPVIAALLIMLVFFAKKAGK
jgi:hypothetical protein